MSIVPRKPAALVLEDQFLIAASIEACLIEIGYETVVALSEKDALAAIAARVFDVAIVDYRLGAGTSDAVINRLEAIGTPYALCSGSMQDDIRERRPGVIVIGKPFTDTDITDAVATLVGATAGTPA